MIGNLPCILFGRFVYGFACGTFTVLGPKFSKPNFLILSIVNETVPIEIKGPIGTIT